MERKIDTIKSFLREDFEVGMELLAEEINALACKELTGEALVEFVELFELRMDIFFAVNSFLALHAVLL